MPIELGAGTGDNSGAKTNANLQGAGYLILSLLIFSLQDVAVKSFGGHYSVMQIVLLRSITALPFTLVFFRREGGRGLPKTQQHTLEYLRGGLLFLSFTAYMMAVAALPLAENAAIRNSAPLMITLLSVLWLGEKVDGRRWLALAVGFLGVLLIVRPGAVTFNLGSIFALLATLTYALAVLVTRKLQGTDSSATMAYYSSVVYLLTAVLLAPLALIAGEPAGAHPSLAFLLRAWTLPTLLDGTIMASLGLIWAGGMYFMARAYSVAQASVVAPFEYVSLLIAVLWGFVIWHETPGLLTWAGAALTLASGFYVLYRHR
jgi:drug/metabolite transporter (DMT)-like permease